MPFCQNCGRPLAENEICTCQNNNAAAAPSAPNQAQVDPAPAQNGAVQPNPAPAQNNAAQQRPVPPPVQNNNAYRQQVYPQQPIYNNVVQQPQKKQSKAWVLLIIIPIIFIVLIVGGILAAILVPSMMGYTKKSKFTSANSAASSLYKAANSTLTEMDSEGYIISGYYIISSNSSYNYNVPSEKFDINEFYDGIEEFFSDSSNYEWFVVVENGYTSYSAISDDWSSTGAVGTYPAGTNMTPKYYGDSSYSYSSSSSSSEKRSLTQLYNYAADKVYELASSYSNEDSYYYY